MGDEKEVKPEEGKDIFLISGLPRSGSTLLCNILLQNPEINGVATSGLSSLMVQARNIMHQNPWFKAMPSELRCQLRKNVFRSLYFGYFDHFEEKKLFDKNREWLAHLEMVSAHCNPEVKVLVTVRDLRDVYASFEKLYRRASADYLPAPELEDYFATRTALGRMQQITRGNAVLGAAINSIKDAFTRGWEKHMHFVEFEELCKNPEAEMQKIYNFLGYEYHQHDFKNVEQQTKEDDLVHGWTTDLHEIRREVKPVPSDYAKVYDASVMGSPFWNGEGGVMKERYFWKDLRS